jgi:hypothetical protein
VVVVVVVVVVVILPFKSNLCLFFKINDIFLKFLIYDINYNKNKKIYNTNSNIFKL